jgi:glycosyltransferase involved in cell wall biosynthesis
MTQRPDLAASMLLDTRCPWLLEVASALAERIRVFSYSASPEILGRFSNRLRRLRFDDPSLEVVEFPVQRGYFSFPLRHVVAEHRRIAEWLQRDAPDPGSTWLVCCYPHYSKVAELWPGPVVYYATDLFAKYEGRSYRSVAGLEKELSERASLVCPNSRRIADYLVGECGCDPQKLVLLPNAVRQSNLLPTPAVTPFDLPPDCQALPRPVAGVIGNMGANLNWVLLEQIVRGTPWLSWLMVGPTSSRIVDAAQAAARGRLIKAGKNIRFVGSRPYMELKLYARSLDVAVLPYMRREPTYSGSSTRFYEHLAACRPILATDGSEELLHKEPLLKILREADEWIDALEGLRQRQFQDGLEELRWRQSQCETLGMRVQTLADAMTTHQAGFDTRANVEPGAVWRRSSTRTA